MLVVSLVGWIVGNFSAGVVSYCFFLVAPYIRRGGGGRFITSQIELFNTFFHCFDLFCFYSLFVRRGMDGWIYVRVFVG